MYPGLSICLFEKGDASMCLKWLLLYAGAIGLLALPAGLAQEKQAPKPVSDYVWIEARGTLQVTDPIRTVDDGNALYFKGTGVTLTVHGETWQLYLGKDKALHEAAKQLNGKKVLVRGTFMELRPLVIVSGTREPPRYAINVASLKSAEAK